MGPLKKKKPMNFFQVVQISASNFCREESKATTPRFCNRKTIICISIYWWFPFFEAIALALLLIWQQQLR
jgi:hypothetical protein